LFRVSCEGGTYIRKLIDDLGKELGIGAHMLELRRMRAGIFEENNKEYPSINLYDFEKAVEAYKKGNEKLLRDIITPAEIITKVFPVVLVKESEVKRLYTGKLIFIEDVVEAGDLKPEQTICVFAKDRFIGMYKTILKNKTFAKAEFVLQPIKNGK